LDSRARTKVDWKGKAKLRPETAWAVTGRHQTMKETSHGDPAADLASRRERGIEAYARIFDVPEKDVPAAMAARVGPVFAEEAFLAAGGPAWSSPALTDRERNM
jgi:hypothetical protein